MQEFNVAIYPSNDGKFLASYMHPITKKRMRDYFKSRSEAQSHKQKIEDKFRKSRVSNYQDLLIEDLIILFIQEKPKSDFSKMKRYSDDFAQTFGQFKVQDLTTSTLKMWLDQIQRENNLKDVTMRGVKCDIDTFFRYLINKEIISDSPLTSIFYKKVLREVSARNILSKSQIEELLNAAKAFSPGYFYPLLRMFVETAAKPNEVLEMTWSQLNLEKQEVKISLSAKSQERTVRISEELAFLLSKNKKQSGFVFMTYYKEPFTRTKLTRLLNEFKVKGNCNIPWTPMDLRHSYAVNFLKAGGDIRRLQQILGHSDVYETKRLYAEVLEKTDAAELNPFEFGS